MKRALLLTIVMAPLVASSGAAQNSPENAIASVRAEAVQAEAEAARLSAAAGKRVARPAARCRLLAALRRLSPPRRGHLMLSTWQRASRCRAIRGWRRSRRRGAAGGMSVNLGDARVAACRRS